MEAKKNICTARLLQLWQKYIYVKVNKKCQSSHRWTRNLYLVISFSYRLKANQISSVVFHFPCHPLLSFELLHSFKYRVLDQNAETVYTYSISNFPKNITSSCGYSKYQPHIPKSCNVNLKKNTSIIQKADHTVIHIRSLKTTASYSTN